MGWGDYTLLMKYFFPELTKKNSFLKGLPEADRVSPHVDQPLRQACQPGALLPACLGPHSPPLEEHRLSDQDIKDRQAPSSRLPSTSCGPSSGSLTLGSLARIWRPCAPTWSCPPWWSDSAAPSRSSRSRTSSRLASTAWSGWRGRWSPTPEVYPRPQGQLHVLPLLFATLPGRICLNKNEKTNCMIDLSNQFHDFKNNARLLKIFSVQVLTRMIRENRWWRCSTSRRTPSWSPSSTSQAPPNITSSPTSNIKSGQWSS